MTHFVMLNFIPQMAPVGNRSSSTLCKQSSKESDPLLFYFVLSGRPVGQSAAVDYGQSEISGFCSKRTAESATNFLIHSYC